MNKCRASGYKNYGMIPANEYTTKNAKKIKNADAVSGIWAESMVLERPLQKQRAQYRIVSLRNRGWLRSRSTNGWRAELASQQHETAHMEGHTNNTRRGKHPFG